MAQTVTVTIQAANGARRTHPYYFADSATEAEIQASMNRHIADLDAMIDGQVVGATLAKPVTLPGGIKASPLATADHDQAGRFIFNTANGYTTIKTVTTMSQDELDLSVDPPVINGTDSDTYVANVITNPDVGTQGTTDYRGDDITAVKSKRLV